MTHEKRFFEFDKVWHVGRYPAPRSSGPRTINYEGNGLSVSVHPQDWAQIAELDSFRVIELQRTDGQPIRLLNAYGAQDEINAWAISSGLAIRGKEFIADHCAFLTREFAQKNRPPGGRIIEKDALLPSVRLDTILRTRYDLGNREQAHPVFQGEIAARYSATLPDVDGTWWAHKFDPEGLSAPSGLIIPERLSLLRITSVGEID